MLPNWFETQSHFFEKNVPNTGLNILQIGAYTGDATKWLLENRIVINIDDVDTWEGSDENSHHSIDFSEVEKTWDARFGSLSNVKKHKMTSDQFFFKNPPGSKEYNFIYIDGDHTATQTALDGLNGFRLLSRGGVIAFDDYWWVDNNSEFLRPKRGIDAFMSICEGEYRVLETGYQVWLQKC